MTIVKSPGDSSTQKEVEKWLIEKLSKRKGVKLTKKRWRLNKSWIELDGFCTSPPLLCEAWAHIGFPKSAQKQKVMMDALKMIFVNDLHKLGAELILLFADNNAAKHFQGSSWMAQCLRKYNIKVEVVKLPQKINKKILEAQASQYR